MFIHFNGYYGFYLSLCIFLGPYGYLTVPWVFIGPFAFLSSLMIRFRSL